MTLDASWALPAALVVLAAKPESKAAKAGEFSRAEMRELIEPLGAKAKAMVAEATNDALVHISLVMKNNPGKTLVEILARDDVQDALQWPFSSVSESVQNLATQAHDAGSALGKTVASAELGDLGVKHGVAGETSKAALAQARGDIRVNAIRAPKMLTDAMQKAYGASGNKADALSALHITFEDLQRRAQYSVEAAGKAAYALAKEDTYGTAVGGVVAKRWVTHFTEATCTTCAGLHGTVVALGEAFDVPESYWWNGPIFGPPIHPNCNCQAVAWKTRTA